MKTALLALLGTACMATTAMAQMDTRDVVRDTNGHIITNSFDNCVRTDWEAGSDACANAPVAATSAPVAAAPAQLSQELLSVYFGFDEATLSASAQQKVQRIVETLKAAKEVTHVQVVGYADLLGSSNYNQALSHKRAQAVASYMHQLGYQNASVVDVAAMGESAPVSRCENVAGAEEKACLWRDRRVEVKVHYQK